MDAFARIHGFWWDHPSLSEIDDLPSVESTATYVDSVRTCFPGFADLLGESLSTHRRTIYDRVLAELPRLSERLTRGSDLTLIHGDAHWGNVLIARDSRRDGSLIIDWQLWGISFAAEDLANLMALQWPRRSLAQIERDLLQRYHRRLVRAGVQTFTWEDCWSDYRLAVVTRVLFMPMWQWSSGQPRRDWSRNLEHALLAYEDLGCAQLVADMA
jgi:Ser/Thr protein kinase RdoA (MazF antagonist)